MALPHKILRLSQAAILVGLGAFVSCSTPLKLFVCQEDSDCGSPGVDGVCEEVGHCSFGDSDCFGGRRFGEAAGSLSNRCVGSEVGDGGVAIDATIDATIGDTDAVSVDGPFACSGDLLPLVLTSPPLTIFGRINDISVLGAEPFQEEVDISANFVINDLPLFLDEFNTSYSFTDPLKSTVPLDLYLVVDHPQRLTSHVYPQAPFSDNNSQLEVALMSQGVYNGLYDFVGVDNSLNEGLVLVTVVDCNGQAVSGATISSSPGLGNVIYGGNAGFPATSRSDTGDMGIAYAFGASAGSPHTISVTVDSLSFRDVNVVAIPNGLTLVTIAP